MSLRRIFVLVVVLLVVAVLIGAASRSQKPEATTQRNPAVINHTTGLELISAVRKGEEVTLVLKNNYGMNVTAISLSADYRVREDFAFSEFPGAAGIFPFATYEHAISISDYSDKAITIEAVVLEDGTADGDAAVVQEIQDHRLGERIQIERILKLLDDYLESPGSKINAGIGNLKSQINSQLNAPEADNVAAMRKLQPARQSNLISSDIQSGLRSAKESALRKLRDVEAVQDTQDIREALLRVKKNYEIVLRRL